MNKEKPVYEIEKGHEEAEDDMGKLEESRSKKQAKMVKQNSINKEIEFKINQSVLFRNFDGQAKWKLGTVLNRVGSVLYEILHDNKTYTRHANQMRQCSDDLEIDNSIQSQEKFQTDSDCSDKSIVQFGTPLLVCSYPQGQSNEITTELRGTPATQQEIENSNDRHPETLSVSNTPKKVEGAENSHNSKTDKNKDVFGSGRKKQAAEAKFTKMASSCSPRPSRKIKPPMRYSP
ncbi:hypothetical protein RN001_008596 [Aquatica leii]|uniref:Uncharacterized protein n=1 Tax=Aquatica leii TaxID=1421715 RepID=A0AAN7P4G2_9COLE|nr:hypothetical protein RN001_008596 [Aquatica leii]